MFSFQGASRKRGMRGSRPRKKEMARRWWKRIATEGESEGKERTRSKERNPGVRTREARDSDEMLVGLHRR